MENLSPSEVKQRLATSSVPPVILDVREPWEFQLVHLPESVPLPLRNLPDVLTEFDTDQEIVVVCHHGIRSMHACIYLENAGFSRLVNLKGGIDQWARELDPKMPVY